MPIIAKQHKSPPQAEQAIIKVPGREHISAYGFLDNNLLLLENYLTGIIRCLFYFCINLM